MSDDIRALAAGAPSATLHVRAVEIDLVRIPPGEFVMGSPEREKGHAFNEAPVRRVRLSKAFYLGRFEITQVQYQAVMGEAPGGVKGDMLPVSQITYATALEFCR